MCRSGNSARRLIDTLKHKFKTVVGQRIRKERCPLNHRHRAFFERIIKSNIFELCSISQTIQIKMIERNPSLRIRLQKRKRRRGHFLSDIQSCGKPLRKMSFARTKISIERNHRVRTHRISKRASKQLCCLNICRNKYRRITIMLHQHNARRFSHRTHHFCKRAWRSAASTVCSIVTEVVTEPMPPGTGVIAPTTGSTSAKSTSPQRLPSSSKEIPTSTTV